MADVSNNLQHEDEFHHHPNPFFFDDYTTSFDVDLTLDHTDDNNNNNPNCFFCDGGNDDDDDEQMNFVTDLFDSRYPHESTLEFGLGPGLRVVDMDSESDSEVNSGFNTNIINDDFGDGDGDGGDDDNDDVFGSFRVSNNGYHVSEEFEWEEVNERVNFDERENLNSVIDRIEEITVSSDISLEEGENSRLDEEEERERNLEWEVLLAVNNLDPRNFEFDVIDGSGGGVPRVNLPDDYILTMEYDALFGQLVENENALKGSPPAAKHVVEGLATVVIAKEDVGENSSVVVCAVCKDEASVGEEVKKMPCCHLYHGDCILPWLKIRNTCPVCRYELPTDDVNYEKRRSGRVGGGNAGRLADDFEPIITSDWSYFAFGP